MIIFDTFISARGMQLEARFAIAGPPFGTVRSFMYAELFASFERESDIIARHLRGLFKCAVINFVILKNEIGHTHSNWSMSHLL